MQASQLTHPRLKVLYRIDGGAEARERVLDLAGYRASTPVRIGNGAVDQVQHDIYGDLLETAWEYAKAGGRIDAEIGWRLAGAAADHVVSVGAGFGLIHGLFAGSALVNILLPIVHPRMGRPTSSIASGALLEPPGFMMLNYGRSTPVVSLFAHVVYGGDRGGAFAAAAT